MPKATLEMLTEAAQEALRLSKEQPSKHRRRNAHEALKLLQREADRLDATLHNTDPGVMAERAASAVVARWAQQWPRGEVQGDSRNALVSAIIEYGDWRVDEAHTADADLGARS